MAFPESQRVLYERNPLADVTLQLRFPPILKIESQPPAAFQDAIRGNYPQYRQVMQTGSLPAGMPPPLKQLIQGMGVQPGPLQHVFETEDKKWRVSLTREAVELKTSAYIRWEHFRERADAIRAAFEEAYRPAYYGRLGLRYVNIISRTTLGLDSTPWSELLKPHIAGELSISELAERIDSASRQLHCQLENANSYLTLKTGIALAEPTKEKCFLIDSDFHTHKSTEVARVPDVLNSFNRYSGRLFQWAIQQRLHAALIPKPLD
jgi:uncharacterized protein (TIGR04255 family)